MVEEWIESSDNKYHGFITSGEWILGEDLLLDYNVKFPHDVDEYKISNRKFYSILEEYAYKKYRYYIHKKRASLGVMIMFSSTKQIGDDYVAMWFDNMADKITLDCPEVGKYMYNDFKAKYPISDITVNTFYKMIFNLAENKFGKKPVKFRSSDGVSFVFRK